MPSRFVRHVMPTFHTSMLLRFMGQERSGTDGLLMLSGNQKVKRRAAALNGVRQEESSMTDRRETRAVIDSETVRGLLLINGGGAVALLAFLSTILGKPGFVGLSQAVIWATFVFQAGLVAAVIHNRFRRLCSFEYSKKQESRKQCSLFGTVLREPCICHWSTGFMWASILAFLLGGLIVLIGGICVLGESAPV